MGTYHQLHAHLVFSTQGRRRILKADAGQRVHGQLGTILREEDVIPNCIGGYDDHVHLLVSFKPTHRLSDVVRILKSRSSKWINDSSSGSHTFAWQRGYSIFSVSHSQLDIVRRYIDGQQQHHRELGFLQELKSMLARHEIEYDPVYIDE